MAGYFVDLLSLNSTQNTWGWYAIFRPPEIETPELPVEDLPGGANTTATIPSPGINEQPDTGAATEESIDLNGPTPPPTQEEEEGIIIPPTIGEQSTSTSTAPQEANMTEATASDDTPAEGGFFTEPTEPGTTTIQPDTTTPSEVANMTDTTEPDDTGAVVEEEGGFFG